MMEEEQDEETDFTKEHYFLEFPYLESDQIDSLIKMLIKTVKMKLNDEFVS